MFEVLHGRDNTSVRPHSFPYYADPIKEGNLSRDSLVSRTDSFDHCHDIAEMLGPRDGSFDICQAEPAHQCRPSDPTCDGQLEEVELVALAPTRSPQKADDDEEDDQLYEEEFTIEESAEDDRGSDSDHFSDVGEPGGTEVLFIKEGVGVWPRKHEKILGRLSLVKQHRVIFLAWLPYSQGHLTETGNFTEVVEDDSESPSSPPEPTTMKGRTMYAIHPIPLSEIKAIHRHSPTLGWHYIVVILVSGLTLPPLFFHNGGVRAFISVLKEHAFLIKSTEDPNTYLVNDIADPLQRSLTTLDLRDILLGAPPIASSSTFPPNFSPDAEGWGGPPEAFPWEGLSLHLGKTLSKVTQFAKDTTSSIFAAMETWHPQECAPLARALSAGGPDGGEILVGEQNGMVVLDHSPAGLGHSHFSTSSAPCLSRRNSLEPDPRPQGLRCRHQSMDLDKQHAADGVKQDSAGQDVGVASTSVGTFELIDNYTEDRASLSMKRIRPPPLSTEEFSTFLDGEGRLVDEAGFKERVFYSGIEPELRREAWKFLLGVYPAGSTALQRKRLMDKNRERYVVLKQQWESINKDQAKRFAKWRERKSRVEKDVRRTDRSHPFYAGREHNNQHLQWLREVLLTYTMYNFDLGYCQGMSDLASPLLYVMREPAEAFWCFVALMDQMEGNFNTDQRGMHAQLLALQRLVQMLDPQLHSFLDSHDCLNYFFCFRWILIDFKREFTFDEVLRLWEAHWCRYPAEHFHLYVAVAVLVHHRRVILEQQMDFDALLKFCIELSGKIDLDQTLRLAEALCRYSGKAGQEALADILTT